VLDVRDLHTYYGDSHVLQGVTLHAARGLVTAVLGRNGVGKTTLCRSIVGLTAPRAGHVTFDGVDLTSLPRHQVGAAGVSFVPQGRRIFPSLTVSEHLAIAARPGAGKRAWAREKVFDLFPRLRERARHYGNELSGGEQQMLAIARALVANPRLLVMDEPTEGLAPAMVAEVTRLIGRLKRDGITVLLVEQNAAFAVEVSDHVHVMSQGTVVHSSPPAGLWQNTEVRTELLGVPGA
jgi:branched-chain amino acid transport system ATP-binding protein